MKPDDFSELVRLVELRSTNRHSGYHGEHHWRCVSSIGVRLAAEVGHPPLVPLLFGLFHDSQRHNDHYDPQHGPRAAEFVEDLVREGALTLDPSDRSVLVEACRIHTASGPTPLIPLGICLDADRVNLWRVGKTPRRRFLSTPSLWKTDWIAECKRLHGTIESWDRVWDDYSAALARLGIRTDK